MGLTSNKGSQDFQFYHNLYKKVLKQAQKWGTADNLMFVIGATQAEYFKEIRKIAPDNFYLVPGVGAQGGDLASVSKYGMNDHCGLLVNSSREIIYAGSGLDFAEKAREKALLVQGQMAALLT